MSLNGQTPAIRSGIFIMPFHDPAKPAAQCYDEDLELIVRAEELGFGEFWIGEHHTMKYENIVMPEIFIARTEKTGARSVPPSPPTRHLRLVRRDCRAMFEKSGPNLCVALPSSYSSCFGGGGDFAGCRRRHRLHANPKGCTWAGAAIFGHLRHLCAIFERDSQFH
jgi:hypothetical protein